MPQTLGGINCSNWITWITEDYLYTKDNLIFTSPPPRLSKEPGRQNEKIILL